MKQFNLLATLPKAPSYSPKGYDSTLNHSSTACMTLVFSLSNLEMLLSRVISMFVLLGPFETSLAPT